MEIPDTEPNPSLERLTRLERRSSCLALSVAGLTLVCAALAGGIVWSFSQSSKQQRILAAELLPAPRVNESPASPPPPAAPVAAASPKLSLPDRLEVKSIVIKDQAGRIRYTLGLTEDGGIAQAFHDDNGQARLSCALGPKGEPSQGFRDQNGSPRLLTSVINGGTAAQTFFSATAQQRASIMVSSNLTAFTLSDNDGTLRYYACVNESDNVRQEFSDRKGTARMVVTTGDDTLPLQTFFDPQGRLRMETRLSPDGDARQSLYDTNNICRVATYANDHGAGQVIYDANQTNRFQILTSKGKTAFMARDEQGKLRGQIHTLDGDVGQIFLDGAGDIRAGTIIEKDGKKINPAR